MFQNYKALKVEDVNAFNDQYKAETVALNDQLVALPKESLSWESFIAPQLAHDIKFSVQVQILNMDDFHPNAEIREVCNKISTEYQKFCIDESMRRDFFQQFKYYYENGYQVEKINMSSERIKYIEDQWRDYNMEGLNLEDAKFERAKEIKKELAEMSSKFSFNLTNENTSFEFRSEELDGMPESWLSTRLQDSGVYKVTLKYPDYLPLMEFCKVRETRKIMSKAFNSRCAVENAPISNATYKLRHEMAELFGYDSYANYSLQRKMAKNYNNVMNFLNSLKTNIEPVLVSDYASLQALADLDGVSKLEMYDIGYYMRIYKEQQTSLDSESVRQYFPLETVTQGMFQIYQQFLSVKFTEITADHVDELWHESVQLFQVNDQTSGDIVGYFYLDMMPREGKYGHAAVFPFVRKSAGTLPICAMACNFTAGRGLTHDEVVTFFHEFGHVMHNVCSETELLAFGGTAVERDGVELPSQCFERWCYASEPLKLLSGGAIPDNVVEKLNKQSTLCNGYHYSRQLVFALTDMALHFDQWSSPPNDVYNSTMKDVLKLDAIEGISFMETFSHVATSGYCAGYYGYLWSEVFCEDIYRTCAEGHELDQEVGLKYRKEILARGGSRNSMEGIVNMLGREPNDLAFIKSIMG